MNKKLFAILLGLYIGIIGLNAKADAYSPWEVVSDTPTSLEILFIDLAGNNATYNGNWWEGSVYFTFFDDSTPEDPDSGQWELYYNFTHLVDPDTLEYNPSGDISGVTFFESNMDYSTQSQLYLINEGPGDHNYDYESGDLVADEIGTVDFHSIYMPDPPPAEQWVDMTIQIEHTTVLVPEPIGSTLFIFGGATLGFIRFRKRG